MKLSTLLTILTQKPYQLSQTKAIDLITSLLNCDRYHFWSSLEMNYWASDEALQKVLQLLTQQYPVDYILQKKHFLGTDFYVDHRVLIPRDETEQLTQLAIEWLKKYPNSKIIDLGTGSGVIGLSLKRFFPKSDVWLSDNSWLALQVAQKNAQLQNLDVKFLLGDYLKPSQELGVKFNLIIANPPYVDWKTTDWSPNLKFEPATALFAPNQGLYFYQQLFTDWKTITNFKRPLAILIEFGFNQKTAIEKLLNYHQLNKLFKISFYHDWNNHWRYLMLETDNNVSSRTD